MSNDLLRNRDESDSMDTSDAEEKSKSIIYIDPSFLKQTKNIKKFINILKDRLTSASINDILQDKGTNDTFINKSYSIFSFWDDSSEERIFKLGFIRKKIDLLHKESDHKKQKKGMYNTISIVKREDCDEYLTCLEDWTNSKLPMNFVHREPHDVLLHKELNSSEIFVAIIASYYNFGPSVYAISEDVNEFEWLMEKGTCDLSKTLLKLKNEEDAIKLSDDTIILLYKLAEVRLLLFDIKIQNLIDRGPDHPNDRVLAIDFDPKFTIFASKICKCVSFVINTILLLNSISTIYIEKNPYIYSFIQNHIEHIQKNLEIWDENEEQITKDMSIILKRKFFDSQMEYIGDFYGRSEQVDDNILEIAMQFKNIFKSMTQELQRKNSRGTENAGNTEASSSNMRHFYEILEWLGVTRTAGCDNKKLLQLASKNLPQNWFANIDSSDSIIFKNEKLQLELSNRPPDFNTLQEQLNWYMKLMINKNKSSNVKEESAMSFYETILSEENRWYLLRPENQEIKKLLHKKLLRFKEKSTDKKEWCDYYLSIIDGIQ